MGALANILDPIHESLDPLVWENPTDPDPKLRPQHHAWIERTVHDVLKKHGYENIDSWLSLVFTGSLTTYQYSDESDVDVSLFVDVGQLPDWDRAEMIGIMVGNVDGTKLPGTPHVMQCFVVPGGITKESLYQQGLRSGYDLETQRWIVPPEHERVHNVEQEYNAYYVYALQVADKMERLLRYEPDKAIMFWHMIHKKRQRDQRAGKGDFAESNIAYKMLNQRGLLPQISEVSGEYIARVSENGKAKAIYQKFEADPQQPGPEMPFIYQPESDTVFLGPPKAYHWQLMRKVPELRNSYDPELAYTGPAYSYNPDQLHGAIDWNTKRMQFYGNFPPEARARVAEALGAPMPQQEDWQFGQR